MVSRITAPLRIRMLFNRLARKVSEAKPQHDRNDNGGNFIIPFIQEKLAQKFSNVIILFHSIIPFG